MLPAATETFRSTPFVCGYLGPGDDDLWARLRASAPVDLTVTAAGPHHAVAASAAPLLETGAGSWTWGRHLVGRRRPADWRAASHELGLAGLWAGHDGARLHADLFGLHDVFHRSIGDTVYFATRIGPLRDLAGGLSTDWDGWGSSLAFGGFVGASTPFQEIRRLEGGESIISDAAGTAHHRDAPDWLVSPGPADAGLAEVSAAVRRAVPGPLDRTRRHLTLSGGWDSRLLALALLRNRARRPTAWTADPDRGSTDDVEMATAVATALRLPHEVVPSGDQAWARHRPRMVARVEHLTWQHTWLGPLASRLREAPSVVDGLGGDVLLRNLFTDQPLLDAPTRKDRLDLQFRALGGARVTTGDALAPALAARWDATAREHMAVIGDSWSDHPSEYVLRALSVRTSRVIAASPMRLFAPETSLLLPFMDPGVVRAALAVPVAAKSDRSFYRALLAGLDPRVGPLPSTNDGLPKTPGRRPSQTRRSALSAMADAVLADEVVLGLLAPATVQRLHGPVDRSLPRQVPLATLQWASALADWRATNRDHLRDDDRAD